MGYVGLNQNPKDLRRVSLEAGPTNLLKGHRLRTRLLALRKRPYAYA